MWHADKFFTNTFLSKGAMERGLELSEAMYWGKLFTPNSPHNTHLKMIGSGVACGYPEVDILAFNRVIGLGRNGVVTPDELKECIDFFASIGSKRFMVQLPPCTLYEGALELLQGMGFWQHTRWVKWYADVQTVKPMENRNLLKIVPVTAKLATIYGEILVSSFGWPDGLSSLLAKSAQQPGYHAFLVEDEGQFISAGALHVEGDFASFAMAGTLAAHRGKGAQSLLLHHRLALARKLKCSFLVSETGENLPEKENGSFANMERIGMKQAYNRPNFVFQLS
jgi:GNAT superfamily N-acetyltransferase